MSDTSQKKYQQRLAEIQERATRFRQSVVAPQLKDARSEEFIGDSAERQSQIKANLKNTIFDAAGDQGGYIAGVAANAVRVYREQRGHLPSAELMAAAQHTIENMLDPSPESRHIFDQAMSTSDGIIKRNHQVALIVPTMLSTITSDMVTHIPAAYDKSEIFSISRRAGSDFGDLHKGDIIDESFSAQYSSMDQRKLAGTGDGTTVKFSLDVGMPVRKELVRVYHDRTLVAEDLGGRGNLSGSCNGAAVTGTVDYDKGGVNVTFGTAPAAGVEVHIAFDVNIEADPSLIPQTDLVMDSWVVRPHESALACSSTIQALFSARREFAIDLNSMLIGGARNLLAAEKDRRRLRDMRFFAKGERVWNHVVPDGIKFSDHYESIVETLNCISMELMARTKTSGLVGIVADSKMCALLKSLPAHCFQQPQGYKHSPQPHYVGRLFGMYSLYEDPQAEEYTGLCFARGRNHGDSGYVAADAISAINYSHSMSTDLKQHNTLYELAYRDLHPKNGRDYFMTLKFSGTGNSK